MYLLGDESIKTKVIILCMIFISLLNNVMASAQNEQHVDEITIRLRFSDELRVPEEIRKRITASTLTIANNVLQGQPIGKIREQKESYENLFHEVLGRILIGYYVKDVGIMEGTTTVIDLELSPWQDSIKSVDLIIENDNVPEKYQNLIKKDLSGVQELVENLLLGLPVDSVYWAGSILKTALSDHFYNKLPEYDYSLDISEGGKTVVKLHLYPKGQTIKDSVLSIKSNTVPNIAFLNLRNHLEGYLETLNGLPVDFVNRHKDFFSEEIMDIVQKDDLLKKIDLRKGVNIIPQPRTQIELLLDSDKYNLSIEGRLDLGRRQDNTSFLLHAGKFIAPKQEIFLESEFVTNNVKWDWAYGFQYEFTDKTLLGYKYNQTNSDGKVFVKQVLGEKFSLRTEHDFKNQLNEFGLRYKLHDFISLEYVKNNDDNWLRLVGNF